LAGQPRAGITVTVLRVATVPDTHPYLDAVRPGSVRHVRFTPPTATGWEPSPLLEPSALLTDLAELDVVHVHFGYEGCSPGQLEDFVSAVRTAGPALVVTVHDLRNPHDGDPSRHLEHVRILVTAADAVITLTPGAAAEVAHRWSRTATVVPHPTLLTSWAGDAQPAPASGSGSPRVVGIHLKSLRTNVVDPVAVVAAAAAGAADAGAVLRVDVHDRGVDDAVLAELQRLADHEAIDLRRHAYFSDDELVAYLRGLDVSVLPYRFGTHSGWLELCRDLGVAVVAPDCGYYAEQWAAVTTYANNERTGLDPDSLRRAVRQAIGASRPDPADPRQRRAERAQVQHAHAQVYADAVRARGPVRA
jgi:glycosyltransferase involved in cell wall biosynthesis